MPSGERAPAPYARRMPPIRSIDPAVQFTWAGGDVMAWDPSMSPARRADLMRGHGVRSLRLELPSGTVNVLAQRLDLASLAVVGDIVDSVRTDDERRPSASVAWFAAMHRYAARLVKAGRVTPAVEPLEGLAHHRTGAAWWEATWRPLPADVAAAEQSVGRGMPPVITASRDDGDAATPDVATILTTLVDRIARTTLAARGWHAVLVDLRGANTRAIRLANRALIADHGQFSVPPELALSIEHLAEECVLMARRATGEPVVRARLRLDTPPVRADGGGDVDEVAHLDGNIVTWPLTLELVDVDDGGRWCTWREVAAGDPAALELARAEHFVELLRGTGLAALHTIRHEVPALGRWCDTVAAGAFGAATIDTEEAAELLETGLDPLRLAGIELLAPERLVRRRPSARGTARPEPADATAPDTDTPGRFGATALVEWEVVVDDAPVSEEALRRAAEMGATLLQVGARWVRVDRAEARRALVALAEHRADHSHLSPLDLLELAAGFARDGTTDERAGRHDSTGADPGDVGSLRGEGWAAQLLDGLPDLTSSDGVVPEGFTATLRPYQRRGLGWLQMLHGLGLGGCLADDMGLGKTPTTLAHLAGIPGPHLVVCPLSVVRNWEKEAARFVPGMSVMVHHGTGRADQSTFADEVARFDLVVTTYQVAARDIDTLRTVRWGVFVLDEAQMVKNPEARTTRAMRGIEARQRIALTGTPVENRLLELWSIFHIVVPGLLGNATRFRERFATPIERRHDAQATAALRQLTGPFLLRRTKADRSLVPDLPDKVEQIAWASLTREQAVLYQSVVEQLMREVQQVGGMQRRGLVLAALTRLKQICNHPAHALRDGSRLSGRSGKLHRFDELVVDLLDAGERALVFTQFTEMGVLLQQHLLERFRHTVPFLHGGVPRAQRDRMVSAFQDDPSSSPLLLVSLKAGGTGLNLTAASRVVHYDRWWNPAVEDQATDRAWRIGQQRSVFVHKLVCEGTVEERIDALINDKKALADAVVGTGGENWLTELDDDALRNLVVLDTSKVRHG